MEYVTSDSTMMKRQKATLEDFKTHTKFLFYDDSDRYHRGWRRGCLNTNFRLLPNTIFIELFAIDVGKLCSVHISKIYLLSGLNEALASIGAQAIKVRLYNVVDLKPSVVNRLRALLPINGEALVSLAN